MKTSSKHLFAVAALAGLVTGCATTKPSGSNAGQPAASCCAKKGSCGAKGSCSAKGNCGASCQKKKGN